MKPSIVIPKHIKSIIYKYELAPITDDIIEYCGWYNENIDYREECIIKMRGIYIFRIKSPILTMGIISSNKHFTITKYLTSRFSEGDTYLVLQNILDMICTRLDDSGKHYNSKSKEISIEETNEHYSLEISDKRKQVNSSYVSYITYVFNKVQNKSSLDSGLTDSILGNIIEYIDKKHYLHEAIVVHKEELQNDFTKYKALIEDLQKKLTDEEFFEIIFDNIDYVNMYERGEADLETIKKIYEAFKEAVHTKKIKTLRETIESKTKVLEALDKDINKLTIELDKLESEK